MTAVIVNGLFIGMVYGLIAVGLVLAYRGTRVVNFAHGETGMVAAFTFYELWLDRGTPLGVAVPVAVAIGASIGALTEVLVVRPIRQVSSPIVGLIGTFAVGSLLTVYASRRWGLSPRFVSPMVQGAGVQIGGMQISPAQLLVLGATVVTLLGLWGLYRFSTLGLAMRVTAADPYAASLVGINTNVVALTTWSLAGGLAAISAVLLAPLVTFQVFFMTVLIIRALAAAIVGGLTSIGGAVTAAVLLGVAEAVIGFKTPITGAAEGTLALFVIALLLVFPSGLVRSDY